MPAFCDEAVVHFLRDRTEIIQGDLTKLSGGSIVHNYTKLVDRFLGQLFLLLGLRTELSRARAGERVALLALGSYGNKELSLASDVDLMILHEGPLLRGIERALLQVLYSLWDAKLEVGYTIVTPPEALTEIRDNFMPKSKKMAIFEFGT